ncbi:Neudesin [Arthrobotrys entomopaga]|nr:Neudesin [Arthrobotrys entomopaga]
MVQARKQTREATPDSTVASDNSTSSSSPRKSKSKSKAKSKAKLIEAEDRVSFGVIDLLRIVLGVVVFSCTLSYFIIGDSYLWGQDKFFRKQWNGIRRAFVKPIYMDEATLRLYNGTDESLPIYLSINCTIYDVTKGRAKYGPGGGYSFFAGRDASRAYITGDFKNDLTWDVSGIDEDRVKRSLGHWAGFFKNHEIYTFVGYLIKDPNNAKKKKPIEAAKDTETKRDEL